MICVDKDSLICDLAETYRIYNYKELPCKTVALFSCGLRDNSRIKMKLANTDATREEILLASIVDRLSTLVWFKTKDGMKGINRPESVVESLLNIKKGNNSEIMAFETSEDFRQHWESIIKQKGGMDGN